MSLLVVCLLHECQNKDGYSVGITCLISHVGFLITFALLIPNKFCLPYLVKRKILFKFKSWNGQMKYDFKNGLCSIRHPIFGIENNNLYSGYPWNHRLSILVNGTQSPPQDLPPPVNGQPVDLSNDELLIWDSELFWASSNEQKTFMLWALVAFIQPFNAILMVCVCERINGKFIIKTHLLQGWHQQKPEAAPGILGQNICCGEHNSSVPCDCSLVPNSFLRGSFLPQDIHIQSQKTIKAKCLL